MEQSRVGEREERKGWRSVRHMYMKLPTRLHVGDSEGVREQHREGG